MKSTTPITTSKKGQISVDLELRPNEINDNLGLDDILFGGDILLTPEQLDQFIADEERNQGINGREKRQAINLNSSYHIFDKTKPIYYVFNESFANPAHRQLFRDAMDYINAYTCLNITEGFGQQQQEIHVILGSGCWSNIGMKPPNSGYPQQLSIGQGCANFATMVHEMVHALGFHHTQNRHDRDNYIRLRVDGALPTYGQYIKVSEYQNNNFGIPYDLGSVMHYLSKSPNGTMETIDKTKRYSIGVATNIAFSDLKMVNALYSCQESCPAAPICKNQGYRNPKNCNVCVCPRGFQGNDCSAPLFNEDTNETCGGLLIAQSTLQTFNGSMNSYSNSSIVRPQLSTCYWHIKAPEGKVVRVKFNSYGGSESTYSPCVYVGLEVRTDTFEIAGARICRPDMIDPTLEYKSPSNLAIVAAFTRYSTINFSFSYWFVDPPIPTEPPTTTIDPRPFTPLNCSGAMDLVFVIDASDTMTAERLEIIKSQLIIAIDQNGIKWDRYDYDNARIGIVLSTGFTPGEPTSPYRYNDLKGCPTGYNTLYCSPTVISTDDLKKAINDIPFYGGNNNDIALSMNISLTGDYKGFPTFYQIFGDQIFNGYGDRSSVPNAMIVISGADSSQVSHASNLLKLAGIQVFSIGFEDLPISQLHAISGNPARAFSTQPGNLANTIRKICTGDFDNFSTITSTPSTSIPTVDPRPFIPLNCSGEMDLVIVIDTSDTMTFERLEVVKSQLIIAINQNRITTDYFREEEMAIAHVGIVLSTAFSPGKPTNPYKYYDIKGCPIYYTHCDPTTNLLKEYIENIDSMGGINNGIASSMNSSLKGDFQLTPNTGYTFGGPLFGGPGDRPNVPNAMIVISGPDTSNVGPISNELKLAGVQVFSIGFQDLPISQLQAISGSPSRSFSTYPENLANTIGKICSGDFGSTSTINSPTSTTTATTSTTTTTTKPTSSIPTTATPTTAITSTTTVDPRPFIPLNCSGEMDLVIVIDASDTMTFKRLEVVKSQLIIAINQNRIRTDYFLEEEMPIAHVGILLSFAWSPGESTSPVKYYDIKDCPYYHSRCDPTTNELKYEINNIDSNGINNGIASVMNASLKGDYNSYSGYIFGGPLFGGPGDRPNVPNAMIVISGPDTSNVSPISNELKLAGVQVFSIGFEDLPISQLQAISGDPSRAFSTSPENLANTIKTICTGI